MTAQTVIEIAAQALSLLLMGIAGVRLLLRLARGETPSGGAARGRALPLRGMLLAALFMLVTRLLLYGFAYGLYRLLRFGEGSFTESFPHLWVHWDVRHYLGIAEEGYTAVGDERLRLVFFPLYPWLTRGVALLTGRDVLFSATLLSLLCACLAAALLYALAEECGIAPGRTVAYLCLNPMSVFFCAAYTEGLFLCLTLTAILLWRRGHGLASALCGMLSALTRMPGVIIAGLYLVDAALRLRAGRLRPKDAVACAGHVLLVFGGLFAYWALNAHVTGSPFTYLTYQRENWFQAPGTFWASAGNTAHYLFTAWGENDWFWTWAVQAAAILFVFDLLLTASPALPLDLAATAWVYTAVVLSPTWLLSGARYLFALPALPLMQAALGGERGHAPRLVLSGLLLLFFTFGYALAVSVF